MSLRIHTHTHTRARRSFVITLFASNFLFVFCHSSSQLAHPQLDMEVLRLLVLPALCAAYGTARAPSGRHASRLAVDPAMAATTAFDLKARWPRHPAGPARRQPRTPSWRSWGDAPCSERRAPVVRSLTALPRRRPTWRRSGCTLRRRSTRRSAARAPRRTSSSSRCATRSSRAGSAFARCSALRRRRCSVATSRCVPAPLPCRRAATPQPRSVREGGRGREGLRGEGRGGRARDGRS